MVVSYPVRDWPTQRRLSGVAPGHHLQSILPTEEIEVPVKIHNKEYFTVAERVARFREDWANWTIETQLISQDEEKVIMKALIYSDKSVVTEESEPQLISTGYAEEVRGSTNINTTSALENAETSAVGRALAFFGLAGTEIASADEVNAAIKQQAAMELIEYNKLVRENFYAIAEAKSYLEPKWGEREDQPNVTDARMILKELGDDVYRQLWKAPTKGGIFTTQEREWLKEPPENAL